MTGIRRRSASRNKSARNAPVHLLAALTLVATIACGQIPTGVSGSLVAGKWSRLDGLNPYRFTEDWNLYTRGTTISGSGNWSGEACCAGTVSITGSFDADSIHLTVNLVTTSGAPEPPRHYRFDGALFIPDQIVGVATADDSTRTVEHFQRQK